jgi:hypothetical protein
MTLIKPSFVESLFHNFFNLDPERRKYFNLVFRLARTIFMQLDLTDKAEELDNQIRENLEEPLDRPIHAILDAYYIPRFYFSRLAYCKVGSGVDVRYVTRYQMTTELEKIKNWCYDEITGLTPYVRFTQGTPFMPS